MKRVCPFSSLLLVCDLSFDWRERKEELPSMRSVICEYRGDNSDVWRDSLSKGIRGHSDGDTRLRRHSDGDLWHYLEEGDGERAETSVWGPCGIFLATLLAVSIHQLDFPSWDGLQATFCLLCGKRKICVVADHRVGCLFHLHYRVLLCSSMGFPLGLFLITSYI